VSSKTTDSDYCGAQEAFKADIPLLREKAEEIGLTLKEALCLPPKEVASLLKDAVNDYELGQQDKRTAYLKKKGWSEHRIIGDMLHRRGISKHRSGSIR